MTRTDLYKAYYFALLFVAAALSVAAMAYFKFSPIPCLAVLLLLLVPGRILGHFWKDLLRGLRLLQAGKFRESKTASERFLSYFRERPWIRHLVWLGSSSYSRNPEVLALNNLGAAEVQLGESELAREHLLCAMKLDPLCPLPYFNMGSLHLAHGETQNAQHWFAEAKRRGHRQDLNDRIVQRSQARFAARDGR